MTAMLEPMRVMCHGIRVPEPFVSCLAVVATVLGIQPSPLFSQDAYVQPVVGIFIPDDDEMEAIGIEFDTALLLGVQGGYVLTPSWEMTLTYAFSPLYGRFEEGFTEPGQHDNAHMYYGAVQYTPLRHEALALLLSAGVGGLIISPEGTATSSHDPLMNLGGGLRWHESARLAVQGLIQDNVHFCRRQGQNQGRLTLCPPEDRILHHFQISAGILAFF